MSVKTTRPDVSILSSLGSHVAIVGAKGTGKIMSGSRDGAIARAEKYFDDGGFLAELQRRVAIPTTSKEQDSMPALQEYVSREMSQSLQKMGYDCTVLPNPRAEYGPFLIARRIEDPAKPTVLTYGHGDVIRGQGADPAKHAGAHLRPRRRDPRPGGPMAPGPVALEDRDRGRPHVWPRHGR